jgi:hypothetical protein
MRLLPLGGFHKICPDRTPGSGCKQRYRDRMLVQTIKPSVYSMAAVIMDGDGF